MDNFPFNLRISTKFACRLPCWACEKRLRTAFPIGRHSPPDGSSPAGRPASHRRLFADFLFRRPEGFLRGPSTNKTPDLPIFSCADVNPSRAADACPPTRKTADKRLARRWTNVLRQNRRRGRRAAAWAKGKSGRCRLGKARRFGKRGRTCLEKRRLFRQTHRFASFALPKPSPLCRAAAAFIPAASLPYTAFRIRKRIWKHKKAPRVKGRRFPRLSGRSGRNIYFLLQKQKRT